MNSANWKVGDVLICTIPHYNVLQFGKEYTIVGFSYDKEFVRVSTELEGLGGFEPTRFKLKPRVLLPEFL